MSCYDCRHFTVNAPFSRGRGMCGAAQVAVNSAVYGQDNCPYNAFAPRKEEEGVYEEW